MIKILSPVKSPPPLTFVAPGKASSLRASFGRLNCASKPMAPSKTNNQVSWRRLLLQLAAIQVWARPGGANFTSRNWYQTLFAENRRVTIRLIREWCCFSCGKPLPKDSTGDHLIAKAAGGTDALENFAPLCQSCNSSKGKKDLLVWWHKTSGNLSELSPDLICAYARVKWTYLHTAGLVDEAAPPEAVELVEEYLKRYLPIRQRKILKEIGGEKADLITDNNQECI